MTWLTPKRRARIYALLTVLVPLVVFYGYLSDTEATMWLGVAAAMLGSGGFSMAGLHTPTDDNSKDQE